MNASAVSNGALRRVLEDTRCEQRCSRNKLTVLSVQVDPYRLDTPAGHRDGAWLAKQLSRAVGDERRIHWRGLHYAIVAPGDILKPNGMVYRNDYDDWKWLANNAGKAARWLSYIDFERIIDNRNPEPVIHRMAEGEAHVTFVDVGHVNITLPHVGSLKPYPVVLGFRDRQPYALTIFGEKTSLEDTLLPIAQRFGADLYLPAGEISDTLLYRMAKDGAADGRTMVVFVLADCDPAGHQMAVSIGRKLQAFRDLCFPDLEFELVPVALTVEQVLGLGLPSTPLKETEKRADRWREAFGIEQTEIDALATLQPDVLEKIVTDAIAPYYDETLDRRVYLARNEWHAAARQILDDRGDGDTFAAIQDHAAKIFAEFEAEIDSINQQLTMAAGHHFELPAVNIPAAELGEKHATRGYLFSSAWSWAKATRALIARKTYGGAT